MAMLLLPILLLLLLEGFSAQNPNGEAVLDPNPCMGEFSHCTDGSCSLGPCGVCRRGQYLCPDFKTCVGGAAAYVQCPGLKGTHLDHELSEELRLKYLVERTTLEEQAGQLKNMAPAIARPGIALPAYNWLNDDEHGVKQQMATAFPDGPSLGAGFAVDTMHEVGRAIGMEMRSLHNNLVNKSGHCCNGVGITAYAPNMNLVHDPRWGRAQEVYSEDPKLSSDLTIGIVTGMQDNEVGSVVGSSGHILSAACCKHYAVYNIETIPTDRHHFNAVVGGRDLWETYLPVFQACTAAAKGAHVMCSYNAINGKPACANDDLLTGVLRTKWGWDGFVVSDYDAWKEITDTHAYAATYEDAGAVGINAGLDQEGGFGTYEPVDALPSAVAAGKTTAEAVATAFTRLMRARIRLGMLDPPTHVNYNNATFHSQLQNENSAKLDLALRAGKEGVTLLKNGPAGSGAPGKMVLPLSFPPPAGKTAVKCRAYNDTDNEDSDPTNEGVFSSSVADCSAICVASANCSYASYQSSVGTCWLKHSGSGRHSAPGIMFLDCSDENPAPAPRKVLVVGQQSADGFLLLGNYVDEALNKDIDSFGPSAGTVSILSGLQGQLGAGAVQFVQGCSSPACPEATFDKATTAVTHTSVAAVVVTIGLTDTEGYNCATVGCESEAHDRVGIELPGNQVEEVVALKRALDTRNSKETSAPYVPLVCVVISGGTLALGPANTACDAIVAGWYPGMRGGTAIAQVLTGAANPAGRTPTTWYSSTAVLPPMGEVSLYPDPVVGYRGVTYRYFQPSKVEVSSSTLIQKGGGHSTTRSVGAGVDYPFGWGLSYTSFEYSKLVAPSTATACENITTTVNVTNAGRRPSDEVVLLFAKTPSASVPSPRIRLVAFTRVRDIAPGESRLVNLQVQPAFHSVVLETSSPYTPTVKVEKGAMQLVLGPTWLKDFLAGEIGVDATVEISSSAELDTCK